MSAATKDVFLFSLRHPRVRASIAGLMVSVLLLVIVGLTYWWPARNAAESLNARIDDRRREISNAEFSAQLAQASGRAAQQVAQIEKKLDASITQAVLVQNLEALARRHNVKIISEAYEVGKPIDGYSSLVHELALQAGYPELRSFIAGLQGLPTFTVVQGAVFGRSSTSTAIKLQLDIITYRRAAGSQP